MRRHNVIESPKVPGRWLVLVEAENDEAVIVGYVDEGDHCENERCLEAIAAGRPWHAVPRWKDLSGAVVNPGGGSPWPTYHFATREEAAEAIMRALEGHRKGF